MTPVPSDPGGSDHGFSGKTLAEIDPEQLARLFHETYERLAPAHGYQTRLDSRQRWEHVPANNRALMTATAAEILRTLQAACVWREPRGRR